MTEQVGNWKKHILVKCTECGKLMGFHKKSEKEICNDCKKSEVVVSS